MKIEVGENREIILKQVYNSVLLEASHGEQFVICMRDFGFEFKYNGIWYEAKEGIINKFKKEMKHDKNA